MLMLNYRPKHILIALIYDSTQQINLWLKM